MLFTLCGTTAQIGPRPPRCSSWHITHRHRHTPTHKHTHTHVRVPLNDAATYTKYNKRIRLKFTHVAGFELVITALKRLHVYALDRTATENGYILFRFCSYFGGKKSAVQLTVKGKVVIVVTKLYKGPVWHLFCSSEAPKYVWRSTL